MTSQNQSPMGGIDPMMLMLMSGSGSNGGGMNPEMMMRMLMPEAFEDDVEPLFQDLVGFGHERRSEGMGILQVRVVPPTLVSARGSLRISLNGTIFGTPADFKKLESFAGRMANDQELAEAYAEARSTEDTFAEKRRVMEIAKVAG